MSWLEKLKRTGRVEGNSLVLYRYNKALGVFERSDVGYDNWTEYCILDNLGG